SAQASCIALAPRGCSTPCLFPEPGFHTESTAPIADAAAADGWPRGPLLRRAIRPIPPKALYSPVWPDAGKPPILKIDRPATKATHRQARDGQGDRRLARWPPTLRPP